MRSCSQRRMSCSRLSHDFDAERVLAQRLGAPASRRAKCAAWAREVRRLAAACCVCCAQGHAPAPASTRARLLGFALLQPGWPVRSARASSVAQLRLPAPSARRTPLRAAASHPAARPARRRRRASRVRRSRGTPRACRAPAAARASAAVPSAARRCAAPLARRACKRSGLGLQRGDLGLRWSSPARSGCGRRCGGGRPSRAARRAP